MSGDDLASTAANIAKGTGCAGLGQACVEGAQRRERGVELPSIRAKRRFAFGARQRKRIRYRVGIGFKKAAGRDASIGPESTQIAARFAAEYSQRRERLHLVAQRLNQRVRQERQHRAIDADTQPAFAGEVLKQMPKARALLGRKPLFGITCMSGSSRGLVAEKLELGGAELGQAIGGVCDGLERRSGQHEINARANALGCEEHQGALRHFGALEAADGFITAGHAVMADVDLSKCKESSDALSRQAGAAGRRDGKKAEGTGVFGEPANVGPHQRLSAAEGNDRHALIFRPCEGFHQVLEASFLPVGTRVDVAALAACRTACARCDVQLERACDVGRGEAVHRDAERVALCGIQRDQRRFIQANPRAERLGARPAKGRHGRGCTEDPAPRPRPAARACTSRTHLAVMLRYAARVLPRVFLLSAVVLLGVVAEACADTAAPRTGAPPPFAPLAQAAAPSGGPALLPPPSGSVLASQSGAAEVGFDPASVRALLDDPRLSPVNAAVQDEAYGKAVQEMEGVLSSTAAKLLPEELQAFRYQLGKLRGLAGDPVGAAKAFAEAAEISGPLTGYARFAAADFLERADQHEAALEQAKQVPDELPLQTSMQLLRASALAGKGDHEAAFALWRVYLGTSRPPSQWVSVSLRFAKALLSRATEAHTEEALKLARRVRFEAPRGDGAGEAKEIEERAIAALPSAKRKPYESPDSKDLLLRAKSQLAARQNREALAVTESLITLPAAANAGDFACEAWTTRADALGKVARKAESADAYGTAIERCAGMPRRVEALYNAGRASERVSRAAEAQKRFTMLEAEFPKHRLADDARLRAAKNAREMGDEATFERLLNDMPDAYPEGDMVIDGLFELALFHIERRDWAGAIAPLERALAKAPRERAYYTAGRLPYFLGRARLETGSEEKGLELLKTTIRDYPLSFYMALAYARLTERKPKLAEEALKAAVGSEPDAPFVIAKHPVFEKPGFQRAIALARLGEFKFARIELDALGLSGKDVPPELLWASVFLLERAGAPGQSHSLLRSAMMSQAASLPPEIAAWTDHYPIGRWKTAWQSAYPRPFAAQVSAESKRSQIPEAFIYAIMREESAFDPRVVSHANAIGLMQLIVPTAKTLAKPLGLPWNERALKRPEINVALGSRFLSILRNKFPDNPMMAIPSYNAGPGAPRKWITNRPTADFDLWVERIPYEETRLYTKRVINSMTVYAFLYFADQPNEVLNTPKLASADAAQKAAGGVSNTSAKAAPADTDAPPETAAPSALSAPED